MSGRRPNLRLIKINRNYTVEELARALGKHKNSVRRWTSQGLPILDSKRPILIHGRDAREWLAAKRAAIRSPCGPGEIYCVCCRRTRKPAGGMADYIPITDTTGNLRGLCPNCESFIHRRVGLERLEAVRGELEVAFPQSEQRLRGCT